MLWCGVVGMSTKHLSILTELIPTRITWRELGWNSIMDIEWHLDMVSDEVKAFMDLWFVWMPTVALVLKYIKSVKDNWNEED